MHRWDQKFRNNTTHLKLSLSGTDDRLLVSFKTNREEFSVDQPIVVRDLNWIAQGKISTNYNYNNRHFESLLCVCTFSIGLCKVAKNAVPYHNRRRYFQKAKFSSTHNPSKLHQCGRNVLRWIHKLDKKLLSTKLIKFCREVWSSLREWILQKV